MNVVVYAVRAEVFREKNWSNQVNLRVVSQFCTGFEHGSRRIAIVRSRYQETSIEDTAVLEKT
jgi:hypothetical protein